MLLDSLKKLFSTNYGRVFFVRLLCLGSSTVDVGEGGASGMMTAAARTLTSSSLVSSWFLQRLFMDCSSFSVRRAMSGRLKPPLAVGWIWAVATESSSRTIFRISFIHQRVIPNTTVDPAISRPKNAAISPISKILGVPGSHQLLAAATLTDRMSKGGPRKK